MFSIYHNSPEQAYKSIFLKSITHINNIPHPSKIKGLNRSSVMLRQVRDKKNNLFSQRKILKCKTITSSSSQSWFCTVKDQFWHVNIYLWERQETSKLLHKHLDLIAGYDDFMTTYCNYFFIKVQKLLWSCNIHRNIYNILQLSQSYCTCKEKPAWYLDLTKLTTSQGSLLGYCFC